MQNDNVLRGSENFNSRSREGATQADLRLCSVYEISIHAPVKGATQRNRKLRELAMISIHAPVKGATKMLFQTHTNRFHFNSRSREGSDHPKGKDVPETSISIHAPVKGAT